MSTPPIGNTVVYHQAEISTAAGKIGAADFPAIVVSVNPDGSVELCVFLHGRLDFVNGIKEGTKPGDWSAPVALSVLG